MNKEFWQKIKYFKPEEFKCPHCGLMAIDPNLVLLLETARINLGEPLKILSGTRCEFHNKEVGGSSKSAHLIDKDGYSHAVDIACNSSAFRGRLMEQFFMLGIRRFGIAKQFLHIDNSKNLLTPAVWLY